MFESDKRSIDTLGICETPRGGRSVFQPRWPRGEEETSGCRGQRGQRETRHGGWPWFCDLITKDRLGKHVPSFQNVAKCRVDQSLVSQFETILKWLFQIPHPCGYVELDAFGGPCCAQMAFHSMPHLEGWFDWESWKRGFKTNFKCRVSTDYQQILCMYVYIYIYVYMQLYKHKYRAHPQDLHVWYLSWLCIMY